MTVSGISILSRSNDSHLDIYLSGESKVRDVQLYLSETKSQVLKGISSGAKVSTQTPKTSHDCVNAIFSTSESGTSSISKV